MTTETGNNRDEKGRFKPGFSGNAGGRPKEYNFRSVIKETLKNEDPKTKRENIVAIVEQAVKMAKRGNLGAIKWLSDRYEGTPKQSIDYTRHGLNEDGTIKVWTTIKDKDQTIWTTDREITVEKIGEKYTNAAQTIE